jgi:hypothetical protein
MKSTPTSPSAAAAFNRSENIARLGRSVSGSCMAWWRNARSRASWSMAMAASRAASIMMRVSASPGLPTSDR